MTAKKKSAAANAPTVAPSASPELLQFDHRSVANDADAAAAAKTGRSILVLGDGSREIAGLNRIPATPADFAPGGGAALYTRPILIDSTGLNGSLNAVALLDGDGVIHGICEIPGGVHLGGKIELPANSLIFG